jgi:hypothetical protein
MNSLWVLRRVSRGLLAVVAGGVAGGVLVFGAVPAGAESLSPWFHLASVSRPENLQPARVAVDEVQQLSEVEGTAGQVVVIEPVSLEELLLGKIGFFELKEAKFVYNASHEEVQVALEGLYGLGAVDVTGGPVGKPATVEGEPYVLTFRGPLRDKAIPLYNTEFSGPLGGFVGEVSLKQVTEGAFEGSTVGVRMINVGDGVADGKTSPVTLVEKLPEGVHAIFAEGSSFNNGTETRGPVACAVASAREVRCTFTGTLPPFEQLEAVIGVDVEGGAVSGELSEATATGGGAPAAVARHPITVAKVPGEATPFGFENYEQTFEGVGGAPDTQAGSHPFQMTTTLDLNQTGRAEPAVLPKDFSFKLPPGLVGNPTAYPRCTLQQFAVVSEPNKCPAGSVIGVAIVTFLLQGQLNTATDPVYNLEPSVGEPARFAFEPAGIPVYLETSVRTGGDYGVTVHVQNVPQSVGFLSNAVTLWGVPADPRHDNARGLSCLQETDGRSEKELILGGLEPCVNQPQSNPPPFLTLPTSCTGVLKDTVEADTWNEPHKETSFTSRPWQLPAEGAMAALDGCGSLAFGSEISVSPDVDAASTPSGLKVKVHVPQEEALNANGLAPSDVKNTTVALPEGPEGLALNPAAADGLEACSTAQIGFTGVSPGGVDEFTPGEPSCPNASKIATATITTPLLPNPLKGFVYLASPQNFAAGPLENPFGSLIAFYLVARDPVSGVLVKLPGSVSLSGTGEITTSFQNTPQFPFENAELEFFGGDRAPLATPAHCGSYTTNATFEPWSNTESHNEVLHTHTEFNITTGPNGSACPAAALAFSPTLASGSSNNNAGAFSQLVTTISREDGQQNIQTVQLHYPPGLSGLLTGVKLCGEAEANTGTCSAESEIGETIVSVGLGGDPFTVTGGKVYLTEKYAGAPFGLSIVNPAKAGPFVLLEGRPVIVRATVQVDPHTAALTVTTDSEGAHEIPTVIDGIPLQIKHVNVTITRPGFTFNPTNCSKTSIGGAITSSQGSKAPVQVPFQVTNCATLKFAPKLAVSTSGKTSKANGASLHVKLTYPHAPFGSQANITRVKVDLPRQLPSRLTTLQKACTALQFQANPGGCPAASIVGHAKAITPLIPVPLEGPAYFVSNGGEAFPNLIIVLQGYGVTVDLVGDTFIHNAITSSTFKSVPDAPVGSFELTLPQKKYSALAANGNLCKTRLTMPTEFAAQNGLQIHQTTPIHITGCQTPQQQLAKALHACHKQHNHTKRTQCEHQAHKQHKT